MHCLKNFGHKQGFYSRQLCSHLPIPPIFTEPTIIIRNQRLDEGFLRRRYEDGRALVISAREMRDTEMNWGRRMVFPLYEQTFSQW